MYWIIRKASKRDWCTNSGFSWSLKMLNVKGPWYCIHYSYCSNKVVIAATNNSSSSTELFISRNKQPSTRSAALKNFMANFCLNTVLQGRNSLFPLNRMSTVARIRIPSFNSINLLYHVSSEIKGTSPPLLSDSPSWSALIQLIVSLSNNIPSVIFPSWECSSFWC